MRSIFFLSLIVLLPLFTISQGFHFGIIAGINSARYVGEANKLTENLSNDINEIEGISGFNFRTNSRVGLTIGFFYDVPIKSSFSIQPELRFIQKGTKISGTGWTSIQQGSFYCPFTFSEDIFMQQDYFDIAVLLKHSFSFDNLNISLFAGPAFSYLAFSKIKVQVEVKDESESETEKFEGIRKTDFSFIFGVIYDMSKTFKIEFRYQSGFIPIFKENYGDNLKILNSGFVINIIALIQ